MTKRDKYYQLLDQYVSGKLSTQERHDLEKKALDDPFFFDAMEGWVKMGNADHAIHLERLQKKIHHKSQSTLARKMLWPIAIVASLLLLFTVGNTLTRENDQSIAGITPEEIEENITPQATIKEDVTDDEITSEDVIRESEKPAIAINNESTSPPQQPSREKDLNSTKEKKATPIVSNDIEIQGAEQVSDVVTLEPKDPVASPTNESKSPLRKSLPGLNNSLIKNKSQSEMSMVAGALEIFDSELDDHIKRNLFLRALKVPLDQKVSYDLTFDSTLTLIGIKTVSESNKLSESIKEFIKDYKSWKKGTIPPNLFGRFNYPPK